MWKRALNILYIRKETEVFNVEEMWKRALNILYICCRKETEVYNEEEMWKRALVYWSRAAAQARIFRIFFCHFYYLIFYLSLLFIRFYYYYLSNF